MYQCMNVYINVCMYLYVLHRVGQQVFWRGELATEDRHAEGRRAGHRAEEQLLQTRQVDRTGRTIHTFIYTYTYRQLPLTYMHFLQTLRAYT